MTRKKIQKIPNSPVRQVLMNHVIKLHPYWRQNIEYMETKFLLMHVSFIERELFIELLQEEENIKYLK